MLYSTTIAGELWVIVPSLLCTSGKGFYEGVPEMTEDQMFEQMIRQKEQAPIALDPARTALVIVDVQRFFTRPDSEFAQVFQKLSPGAIDGYFRRVHSTVL